MVPYDVQVNGRFTSNVQVKTWVNGEEWLGEVLGGDTLLEFLRDRLGLRGVKRSCESQVCGACTILVDGKPVSSCSLLAFEIDDKHVMTVEGLGKGEETLGDVQRAFVNSGAIQCGYCTSGQILAASALLDAHPDPEADTVRHWMAGNICRCGCYPAILTAIGRVVEERRTQVDARSS